MEPRKFIIPIQIVTKTDVSRLIKELNQIDEFLQQVSIHQPGSTMKLPKSSDLLNYTAEMNRLNLLNEKSRATLSAMLNSLKSSAPIIHLSFSTNPTSNFIEKILQWLRSEVNAQILLNVGLQPEIGAGCIVRGNSLFLDLSLRNHFFKKRDFLISKLEEGLSDDNNLQMHNKLNNEQQESSRLTSDEPRSSLQVSVSEQVENNKEVEGSNA